MSVWVRKALGLRDEEVKILTTTKPWTFPNVWRSARRWYYHPARSNDVNDLTLAQIRTEPFGGQGANGELIAEIRGDELILGMKSHEARSSRSIDSRIAESNGAQNAGQLLVATPEVAAAPEVFAAALELEVALMQMMALVAALEEKVYWEASFLDNETARMLHDAPLAAREAMCKFQICVEDTSQKQGTSEQDTQKQR